MDIVAPFSDEYCAFFYYLSIIGYILFILGIGVGIYQLFSKKKLISYNQLIMAVFGYFIFYFQNRLLYSMCIKSL
jgi:hypothetical protein